jgi:hypothetical protein
MFIEMCEVEVIRSHQSTSLPTGKPTSLSCFDNIAMTEVLKTNSNMLLKIPANCRRKLAKDIAIRKYGSGS